MKLVKCTSLFNNITCILTKTDIMNVLALKHTHIMFHDSATVAYSLCVE